MSKMISTSALAKQMNVTSKVLFSRFERAGYLVRCDNQWVLTALGLSAGGETTLHEKYGRYVVWPETLLLAEPAELQSARDLAQSLSVSEYELRQLLLQLGWLQQGAGGLVLTPEGRRNGAGQRLFASGPVSYWPVDIDKHGSLKRVLNTYLGLDAEANSTHKSVKAFQHRFNSRYRTMSGHWVANLAHLKLANWFYLHEINFAFEQPWPESPQLISDFFIPSLALYIEVLDSDNQEQQQRLAQFQQHQHQYLVLSEDEISAGSAQLMPKLRAMGLTF
ncbi:hypothetical protein [Ferrimonas lipolytica]|uniref:Uncharacterized protein n=1 Tax=Ferrimonas lipolytica TaxID=2724191 RepID=A0A6H1UCE2_9GAMM|nr:hypothetical protein [Ferrimonas lipolytica]QIZ76767.1 hypothetical protein HER31_07700 [Ferrimonas lipolytica]